MTISTPANQGPDSPEQNQPVRPQKSKKPGGGTAIGGGTNFQAAVTAIAGVHLLLGMPLPWLTSGARLVGIWSESEEGGDDLRLELASGGVAEVQAKKGLKRNSGLWEAIDALLKAVRDGHIQDGVLAVAPDSSGTVKDDLANDLTRIGEGRVDQLSDIGEELHRRLKVVGGNWQQACRHLRVQVVNALDADGANVHTAKAMLREICFDVTQVEAAWDALYRDAVRLMEHRGRWSIPHLLSLLERRGIKVRDGDFPASIVGRLATWVASTHSDIGLPGSRRRLGLNALLEMKVVRAPVEQPEAESPAAALQRYHDLLRDRLVHETILDAEAIGRFKRLAVVVAGPGLGKSTLIHLLASRYANDGLPVIRVDLKPLAAAMERGDSFEQSLFRLGLDGSGIQLEMLKPLGLRDLVVLADGLDECGRGHEAVSSALNSFAKGHPSARVVVTTRPIGYTTSELAEWSHYRLLAPKEADSPKNLAWLLGALDDGSTASANWSDVARRELAGSPAKVAIGTSPHLLAMAAVLINKKGKISDSRTRLYSDLLRLLEAPIDKAPMRPVAPTIRSNVLRTFGWQVLSHPLEVADRVVGRCADELASALGRTPLAAVEVVEDSLKYWEALGIIEQVHHDGMAYWTFVHKTFAEYSAAEHLASLRAEQLRTELVALSSEASWREVLRFASGLGHGNVVVDALVLQQEKSGSDQLLLALELADDIEANVPLVAVERIVDYAFRAMDKGGFGYAVKLGDALAAFSERHPDAVLPHAMSRLQSEKDIVQITAWACAVTAEPARFSPVDLDDVLDRFLPMLDSGPQVSLLGALVLSDDGNQTLISRIALAALSVHSDADCLALAMRLFKQPALRTSSFYQQVSHALQQRRIDSIAVDWIKPSAASRVLENHSSWMEASGRAWRAVVTACLDSSSTTPQPTVAPGERRFLQLGALESISGYRATPASDFYAWNKPYDTEAVKAVVQALIRSSVIDQAELALEAGQIASHANSDSDYGSFQFDTLSVDVPDPDWRAAAQGMSAHRDQLISAMNQGTEWMASLASNILRELPLTLAQAEQLLASAISASARYAVEVTLTQRESDAAFLFLNRLVSPLPASAEYLYRGLRHLNVPPSEELREAVHLGLRSDRWEVSCAAAELAKDLVGRGGAFDAADVLAAYEGWRAREPESRGSVELSSPRETLLELLADLQATTDELLLSAVSDKRHDVSQCAENLINRAIDGRPLLRQALVERVSARDFNPTVAAHIFQNVPPFSTDQIKTLEPILRDKEPRWRRAGLELLRPNYFSPEDLKTHLEKMADDSEAELRRGAEAVREKLGLAAG